MYGITGTLKDFSITEIVQLIGQQLKTGVLKIRKAKKIVEIYFVDGMIVHVFSNYRGKKDLIGEILVKAKLISEDQLERVLRIQKGRINTLVRFWSSSSCSPKRISLKLFRTRFTRRFMISSGGKTEYLTLI